jgi:hypothetical protein
MYLMKLESLRPSLVTRSSKWNNENEKSARNQVNQVNGTVTQQGTRSTVQKLAFEKCKLLCHFLLWTIVAYSRTKGNDGHGVGFSNIKNLFSCFEKVGMPFTSREKSHGRSKEMNGKAVGGLVGHSGPFNESPWIDGELNEGSKPWNIGHFKVKGGTVGRSRDEANERMQSKGHGPSDNDQLPEGCLLQRRLEERRCHASIFFVGTSTSIDAGSDTFNKEGLFFTLLPPALVCVAPLLVQVLYVLVTVLVKFGSIQDPMQATAVP